MAVVEIGRRMIGRRASSVPGVLAMAPLEENRSSWWFTAGRSFLVGIPEAKLAHSACKRTKIYHTGRYSIDLVRKCASPERTESFVWTVIFVLEGENPINVGILPRFYANLTTDARCSPFLNTCTVHEQAPRLESQLPNCISFTSEDINYWNIDYVSVPAASLHSRVLQICPWHDPTTI
jgi:hypothetical protein